jgi:hypothetical protein
MLTIVVPFVLMAAIPVAQLLPQHAGDTLRLEVGSAEVRGRVIAPFWSPGMRASEARIFSVRDKVMVNVEGTEVSAWKVA